MADAQTDDTILVVQVDWRERADKAGYRLMHGQHECLATVLARKDGWSVTTPRGQASQLPSEGDAKRWAEHTIGVMRIRRPSRAFLPMNREFATNTAVFVFLYTHRILEGVVIGPAPNGLVAVQVLRVHALDGARFIEAGEMVVDAHKDWLWEAAGCHVVNDGQRLRIQNIPD